ncbi:nitronate monooxygenase [Caproicibacterium sp. BJN0003]|uniref:nitronate monooxygenase n=1 Tax=Caproicibacterium sp. BJN0003 TaxID=2994078 RepID=UPI0022521569|nr:nitronate monooxygenase [Caproicibacterium sp. BJN0003]UZT82054.1 nitronate monooxygenase [Caproicibacterium sp. BJN0003]
MIHSPICDLFGIKYPIFQGGMAWVADASLAAGVSNAGGLGLIAGMNSNGEQLRAEIRKCRELTDKPFGVNVMLMSPFVEEVAQTVIEEKVPIVTTGAGVPGKYMPAWLKAGIKVVPVVASVNFAKRAVRNGACAVVAEGCESGGHIGELTTMAMVPQIVDAVDVPVLAAGGIADGRQAAAAFMLGAQGIQVGTRFLVAKECTISEIYKERILKSKDTDTIVTGRRTGDAVRALKSPFSREFAKQEADLSISEESLQALGTGALRKAAREGDLEHGCFLAGQVASMVKEEQTCAEIIEDLFSGAETALKGASKWIR